MMPLTPEQRDALLVQAAKRVERSTAGMRQAGQLLADTQERVLLGRMRPDAAKAQRAADPPVEDERIQPTE
jgi:hypothetical protein